MNLNSSAAACAVVVLVATGVGAFYHTHQRIPSPLVANRSKDLDKNSPRGIPDPAPLVTYVLPGKESFQIVTEKNDPQKALKEERASELIQAGIVPAERLNFFAPYQTKGHAFERFRGTIQVVEETSNGWRVTIEIKLIPAKSTKRKIPISTFIEVYKFEEGTITFVDHRAGTKYASGV